RRLGRAERRGVRVKTQLGAVDSGGAKLQRTEQAVDFIKFTPADERERAVKLSFRLVQRCDELPWDRNPVGPVRDIQERAVDIEKQGDRTIDRSHDLVRASRSREARMNHRATPCAPKSRLVKLWGDCVIPLSSTIPLELVIPAENLASVPAQVENGIQLPFVP